jgi:hypothetical protein
MGQAVDQVHGLVNQLDVLPALLQAPAMGVVGAAGRQLAQDLHGKSVVARLLKPHAEARLEL